MPAKFSESKLRTLRLKLTPLKSIKPIFQAALVELRGARSFSFPQPAPWGELEVEWRGFVIVCLPNSLASSGMGP